MGRGEWAAVDWPGEWPEVGRKLVALDEARKEEVGEEGRIVAIWKHFY